MVCDLLDLRCIFVSELIGSAVLAALIGAILYFLVASKLKFGFDTTIALSFPLILIIGLAITGFNVILAFGTVLAGALLAWVFNKLIAST